MEEELIGQISENDNLISNISSDNNLEGNISTSGKIIASMIAERGPTGQQGQPGTPGEDGNGIESIELTSTVGKDKTYTITFTNGTTTTFNVTDGNDGQDGADGQPGQDGQDGADGISPSVSISKVGKVTTITIIDAEGTHIATINDGQDGQGTGDMLKSVYDTNDDGIVDNAEKVNNHTVNKDVPSDAKFTDTVYDDTPVTTIESKIPNQASSTNQLADKDFVNSSINSVTAFYITKNADGDQFNTKAELLAATTFYSGGQVRVPTRNDYCIVLEDESKQNPVTLEKPTTRYIYQNSQWEYQYTVNETVLTAAQLAALNSGITNTKVNEFEDKYDKPNSGIPKTDLSDSIQTTLDKADSAIQNVKTINNTDVKGTGDLKNTIVDLIYPVGAIYISANIVNPSTLFGGTWEQIKDRFLLSAGDTYVNGSTGGEASHTLTTAEMPSHTHTYAKVKSPTGGPSNNTSGGPSNNTSGSTTLTTNQIPAHNHVQNLGDYNAIAGTGSKHSSTKVYGEYGTASDHATTYQQITENTGGSQGHTHTLSNHTHSLSSHTHTTSTESVNSGGAGNGNAHNNMPPYLAVYVWKRTA